MPTSFANLLEANVRHRRWKVARLLGEARRAANLAQEAVAMALDYQQADISRIEKGKRTVNIVELENFALLYGKSLEHFATWYTQLEEDKRRAEQKTKNVQLLPDNFFASHASAAMVKRKWRWKNYNRRVAKGLNPRKPTY